MRRLTIAAVALGLMMTWGGMAYAAARTKVIRGEVIDTYCYALMGAKGESHRSCGLECAAKGIPVGLVEARTNKVYVLLPNKDKSPVPKEAINKMGRPARYLPSAAASS